MIKRLSQMFQRLTSACHAYILIMPDDVMIIEKEC